MDPQLFVLSYHYLTRNFTHGNADRSGNPLPVGRISLQAVVDVTDFYGFWGVAHGPCRILKEDLLLRGVHHPEQGSGL